MGGLSVGREVVDQGVADHAEVGFAVAEQLAGRVLVVRPAGADTVAQAVVVQAGDFCDTADEADLGAAGLAWCAGVWSGGSS